MPEHSTYHFKTAVLSQAVVERLQQNYPALRVVSSSTAELVCDCDEMLDGDREALDLDLRFFDSTPYIALENLCSSLQSYQAYNASQTDLLSYANKLLELDSKAGAGLFMYGSAGIGKTHMAVSLAKQFLRRGYQPNFQSAERYSFSTQLAFGDEQVWIIDDLNSGYGVASRLFREVVINVHERGGRLFITSNKSYDELIRELFVGEGPAQRARYEDRTKGMMKIVHVDGDSQRQATAWYT